MSDPRFTVQGWCPGALRPMESGDGWVVRVRAPLSRLSQAQAQGLAEAAQRFGNGRIDLSARANLQLRGVTPDTHPALMAALQALGLLDPDARAEARRNILLSPFADAQALTIAKALTSALQSWPPHNSPETLPDLPGKFGFALDCGAAPVLQGSSADIRLERAAEGGLILRADGSALGAPVTAEAAPAAMLALAQWFIAAGGVTQGRGRMAALIARGVTPDGALAGALAPAAPIPPPEPGLCAEGRLVGLAFGQMQARTLAALAQHGPIRLTPWRMLLLENPRNLPPTLPDLILHPGPLLHVDACTGAPGCPQALQETRDLARRLATQVPPGRHLHVSGCAKGCAHPGPADVTLVATQAGFDVIRHGSARDRAQGHMPSDLPPDLKGLF